MFVKTVEFQYQGEYSGGIFQLVCLCSSFRKFIVMRIVSFAPCIQHTYILYFVSLREIPYVCMLTHGQQAYTQHRDDDDGSHGECARVYVSLCLSLCCSVTLIVHFIYET